MSSRRTTTELLLTFYRCPLAARGGAARGFNPAGLSSTQMSSGWGLVLQYLQQVLETCPGGGFRTNKHAMISSPPVCSATTSSSRHLFLTLSLVTRAGGKAATGGGRPGPVGAPEDSSDVLVLGDSRGNLDLQHL